MSKSKGCNYRNMRTVVIAANVTRLYYENYVSHYNKEYTLVRILINTVNAAWLYLEKLVLQYL